MDIKSKAEEIISKVKNDKDFEKQFKSNPVKAVEKIVGVDLPDEQINKIVDSVKSKVKLEDVAGKLGGLVDKIKG